MSAMKRTSSSSSRMANTSFNTSINTSTNHVASSANYMNSTSSQRSRSTPRGGRQTEEKVSPKQAPIVVPQQIQTVKPATVTSSAPIIARKFPATITDLSEDERSKINRVVEKLFEMTGKYEDTLNLLHKEREDHQNEVNQIYEKINGQLLIIEDKMKLKDNQLQALFNKEHILTSLLVLYQRKLTFFQQNLIPEKENQIHALQQQLTLLNQEKAQLHLISQNDKNMITLLEADVKEKNSLLYQSDNIKIPKLETLLQQEITKTRKLDASVAELQKKIQFQSNEITLLQQKVLENYNQSVQKSIAEVRSDSKASSHRPASRADRVDSDDNASQRSDYSSIASDRDSHKNHSNSYKSAASSREVPTAVSRPATDSRQPWNNNNDRPAASSDHYHQHNQQQHHQQQSRNDERAVKPSIPAQSASSVASSKKPRDDSTINYDVMFDTSSSNIHILPDDHGFDAFEEDILLGDEDEDIVIPPARSHRGDRRDNLDIEDISRKYLGVAATEPRRNEAKSSTVARSFDSFDWKKQASKDDHTTTIEKTASRSADNSPARRRASTSILPDSHQQSIRQPQAPSSAERKRRTTEMNQQEENHPSQKRVSRQQSRESDEQLNNSLNLTSSTISSFFVSPDHLPPSSTDKTTRKSVSRFPGVSHSIEEIEEVEEDVRSYHLEDDDDALYPVSRKPFQSFTPSHRRDQERDEQDGEDDDDDRGVRHVFSDDEEEDEDEGSEVTPKYALLSKLGKKSTKSKADESKKTPKSAKKRKSVVSSNKADRSVDESRAKPAAKDAKPPKEEKSSKSSKRASILQDEAAAVDSRKPLSEKDRRKSFNQSSKSLKSVESLDSTKDLPSRSSIVIPSSSATRRASVSGPGIGSEKKIAEDPKKLKQTAKAPTPPTAPLGKGNTSPPKSLYNDSLFDLLEEIQ